MMQVIVRAVLVTSGFHVFLGMVSICVGMASSIKTDEWLAHNVSPIWSGPFFIVAGVLGVFCTRRKSSYVIMCFTAFSVVAFVTAMVSIQLLRLGLASHGQSALIYTVLGVAGTECLMCCISALLSCRLAKRIKEEMSKERVGMFHVKEAVEESENRSEGFDYPMEGIDYELDNNAQTNEIEEMCLESSFQISSNEIFDLSPEADAVYPHTENFLSMSCRSSVSFHSLAEDKFRSPSAIVASQFGKPNNSCTLNFFPPTEMIQVPMAFKDTALGDQGHTEKRNDVRGTFNGEEHNRKTVDKTTIHEEGNDSGDDQGNCAVEEKKPNTYLENLASQHVKSEMGDIQLELDG